MAELGAPLHDETEAADSDRAPLLPGSDCNINSGPAFAAPAHPPHRPGSATGRHLPKALQQCWAYTTQPYVLRVLAFGQILAVLNCGTAVTSQVLSSSYDVNIPTAQSFINYCLLAAVFGGQLLYHRRFVPCLRERGWKYALVALVDVEANYTVVKAYQYTTLTSIQLLDGFTIPFVVALSWLLLRTRFRAVQILGVAICLAGLGAIIGADATTHRHSDDGKAKNAALGDALCIIGSFLYALSNVAQEGLVKQFDNVEFLGMIGFFGTFINGLQLAILERQGLRDVEWKYPVVLLLIGFALFLFTLYSLVPILMRLSSATIFNLSLLTTDFYSLLFGLFLFHYKFSALYFLAFALVVIGVLIYHQAPPAQPQIVHTLPLTDESGGLDNDEDGGQLHPQPSSPSCQQDGYGAQRA